MKIKDGRPQIILLELKKPNAANAINFLRGVLKHDRF